MNAAGSTTAQAGAFSLRALQPAQLRQILTANFQITLPDHFNDKEQLIAMIEAEFYERETQAALCGLENLS